MVICLLVAVGCGGYLAYYYHTSSQTEKAFDDLRDMIVETTEDNVVESENGDKEIMPEMVTVKGVSVQKKFEKLYSQNNDFVGWLTIKDTLVDYPVMHTPNDCKTEKIINPIIVK